jgi:phosphoglycolate phosphatase
MAANALFRYNPRMDYSRAIPEGFKLYVLDLDGTLVDSLEDLFLSVNWILARKGFPSVDRETVRRAVGNGARNLLARCFAASSSLAAGGDYAVAPGSCGRSPISAVPPSVAELDAILEEYRAYYDAHCMEHTALYPGMRDWLDSRRASGSSLVVLTNKPEGATQTLLAALGVSPLFSVVAGPETYGSLKPDPAGIRAIMNALGATNGETAMVGDSAVDVETARNAGVAAIALTGGLGDGKALRAALDAYMAAGGDTLLVERT